MTTIGPRYARHVALDGIGEAGQARIAAGSALIVGVGGLGCPAAQYLAGSGIGTLLLNDFDTVDVTNLPRQVLFTGDDVGARKAEAAVARLAAANPDVTFDALPARLDADGLAAAIARVDVVLDCVDNFTARLAINAAAVEAGVPLVSGAALRFEGQIAVFPNAGRGPCYRCLYSEADELLGTCQGNGVLAPVPGVVGTLMANEALQLLATGSAPLAGRLQLWDGRHGSWQTLDLRQDPDCPVCTRARPG